MTIDSQSVTAGGALIALAGFVMRVAWTRLQRFELRTEKRLDVQEEDLRKLRAEQSATSDKYHWLKGWTESARNCSVTGCPNRSNLTPPSGQRIPSDPGNPSIPRITPLVPR